MKLLNFRITDGFRVVALRENARQSILRLRSPDPLRPMAFEWLNPLAHLVRMQLMLGSNLLDCLITTKCLKHYFGPKLKSSLNFELPIMAS